MNRLPAYDIATGPEGARQPIENVLAAYGFIPNPIGVLASEPEALETYPTAGQIDAKSALNLRKRKVVQITAARINGCDFCTRGYTKIGLQQAQVTRGKLVNLQAGEGCGDARLDASGDFTGAVIAPRAAVSYAKLEHFYAAGFDSRRTLDVLLSVNLATLCNFANNLAYNPVCLQLHPYLTTNFRLADETQGRHAR